MSLLDIVSYLHCLVFQKRKITQGEVIPKIQSRLYENIVYCRNKKRSNVNVRHSKCTLTTFHNKNASDFFIKIYFLLQIFGFEGWLNGFTYSYSTNGFCTHTNVLWESRHMCFNV